MRITRWIAAFLLVAIAAIAQDTRVEEFDPGGLVHPNWAYAHEFNVRMVGGGRNSGREAQTFTCSLAELNGREGRCSKLPSDDDLEYGYPVRIDDSTPHRMAEYLGSDLGWRVRAGSLAKTTQGLARAKYVKRSPGQGAMLSLNGINAAQGDFMGVSLDVTDYTGAQAGGDEGLMPLVIYMRDHKHPATGTTTQTLEPGASRFRSHVTSGKEQHDDHAAPRRLIVWTDGPRVPFDVSLDGHNPKAHPPMGGASWVLDADLVFPDGALPATARDVFGYERTDWCATLDATAYGDRPWFNYVLVSRFDDAHRFTTHRLHQGQNVGVYENEYVRGFISVDHAVGAGHGRGHLAPCSLVTGYDSGQQQFSIAPLIDSGVARGTAYAIPPMGVMGPQGIKVTYDFKLGSGGARTGVLVNTMMGDENRMGDRAFVAAGHWGKGFSSYDSEAMLHDYHPSLPAPKYVFAELRGSSSWNGHEFQIWYPEPKGRGQARVQLPHYPGDSAFVLVSRGKGPPTTTCLEPGLQRYYDLVADREYICSSALEWKRH